MIIGIAVAKNKKVAESIAFYLYMYMVLQCLDITCPCVLTSFPPHQRKILWWGGKLVRNPYFGGSGIPQNGQKGAFLAHFLRILGAFLFQADSFLIENLTHSLVGGKLVRNPCPEFSGGGGELVRTQCHGQVMSKHCSATKNS